MNEASQNEARYFVGWRNEAKYFRDCWKLKNRVDNLPYSVVNDKRQSRITATKGASDDQFEG